VEGERGVGEEKGVRIERKEVIYIGSLPTGQFLHIFHTASPPPTFLGKKTGRYLFVYNKLWTFEK
jgi:hypothetical protein